jgi:hypothetical protein
MFVGAPNRASGNILPNRSGDLDDDANHFNLLTGVATRAKMLAAALLLGCILLS